MATKWGIAGSGLISSDFVRAMALLPKEEHNVVAVAARRLVTAQNFADDHGISKAYGEYSALGMDPNVEVVYIATIHPTHFPIAKMMLEAGKNVLCEKPLCMTPEQTKELVALARKNDVFLSEGVWSRFLPVYDDLRNCLQAQELGTIHNMTSVFGMKIADVNRVGAKELGGGTTYDISVYGIQLALMAFKGRKLEKIVAAGHLNDQGVEISTTITLLFSGGGNATIISTGTVECVNDAWVFGSKGNYKIHSFFWTPTERTKNGCHKKFDPPETDIKFNYKYSEQLSFEASAVRSSLLKGLKEDPRMTHDESIQMSEITQEVLNQLNVHR